MSVGTAFHERTAALNHKMQWREWSGYFAASAYSDHHDIEYNAIREGAALIDVSPLFKYRIEGPDAARLVDRVITRDATKLQVGQVYYTPWCDETGKMIDDGTVHRLAEDRFRWTAADPSLRWLRMNSWGLDVEVTETTESEAVVALQGPRSRAVLEAAAGESFTDLRYFRRRGARIADMDVDVSRTGYTGDLGYELWVESDGAVALWDALMEAGADHAIRPAGMLALDVARIEAGLILIEADFISSRHALNAEQSYSPFELNLGWAVNLKKGEFIGRRALRSEAEAGGPPRRLVGIELDWDPVERLYGDHDLPPAMPAMAWRTAVPLFKGATQIGRATSGTWSPTLKRNIALASVPPRLASNGTRLTMEWTVEAHRSRVPATVVAMPFFDPPRKRA